MFYMEDRNSVQLQDLLPSCIIQEIQISSEDEMKEESDSDKEENANIFPNSNKIFNDLSPQVNKYDPCDPFVGVFRPDESKTKSLPINYKNSLVFSEDANETNTSSPKSRLFESNNCLKYRNSDDYFHNSSYNTGNEEMTNYLFYSLRPMPRKTISDARLVKFDSQIMFEDKSTIKEILCNFSSDLHEFIKTQKGSKILQNELNFISVENLEFLLNKIYSHLPELMIDTYGNYFCQKLIKSCKVNHRMKILESIYNEFSKISKNNSGTHSIQCLIEIISSEEEEELVKKCVENEILHLSYDTNATHVIQKIVGMIKEEKRENINKVLFQNMKALVLDQNGICVIKKLVAGNTDMSFRHDILQKLTDDCIEIIQNPFGNYIIQYTLDLWGADTCSNILQVIEQNLVTLSMQKYSSNVVEKCFDLISSVKRVRWINELFHLNKIMCLIKNKYGNYVLQKAVQMMSFSEKSERKLYLTDHLVDFHRKDKMRLRDFIDVI